MRRYKSKDSFFNTGAAEGAERNISLFSASSAAPVLNSRSLILKSLIILFPALAVPLSGFAQPAPGTKDLEQYQNWVKDDYLPKQQGNYDEKEKEVKDLLEQLKECSSDEKKIGSCPKASHLLGSNKNDIKSTAKKDADELKQAFTQCNGNRASYGEFFKPPRIVPFSCVAGGASDLDTGHELSLLCRREPTACGVHYDNPHPGRGLSMGLAIMEEVPSMVTPPCTVYYKTATYVQYYFPWFLLNASRQMFQSSYLEEEYVKEARKENRKVLQSKAKELVKKDLKRVNQIAKQEMSVAKHDASFSPDFDKSDEDIERAMAALDKLDENLRDTSPHAGHGYARNLSSILDVEMMSPEWFFVPHFGKDSHRFGTDLPYYENGKTPKPLPLPYALSSKGNYGGFLNSRFFEKSDLMGEEFKMFNKSSDDGGGPFICLRANKYYGKTPDDLLPEQEAEKEDYTICLTKIGNRFPLMADSFSLHDTDAFWRAAIMGGLDMFYMLNWPQFVAGRPQDFWALPVLPFHTYSERYDKFYVTSAASDENFVKENGELGHQCEVLEKMTEYNVNFKKANMHKAKWGGENTVYIFGLVKGAWNYKGRKPIRPILRFGDPLEVSEVELRFH